MTDNEEEKWEVDLLPPAPCVLDFSSLVPSQTDLDSFAMLPDWSYVFGVQVTVVDAGPDVEPEPLPISVPVLDPTQPLKGIA